MLLFWFDQNLLLLLSRYTYTPSRALDLNLSIVSIFFCCTIVSAYSSFLYLFPHLFCVSAPFVFFGLPLLLFLSSLASLVFFTILSWSSFAIYAQYFSILAPVLHLSTFVLATSFLLRSSSIYALLVSSTFPFYTVLLDVQLCYRPWFLPTNRFPFSQIGL